MLCSALICKEDTTNPPLGFDLQGGHNERSARPFVTEKRDVVPETQRPKIYLTLAVH